MESKLKPYKNWFKWDYSARHDKKLKKLIMKEGPEGYGLFVMIIELLYEFEGYADYDTIVYELRFSDEKLDRVLNDYDLFIIKDKVYSNFRVNTSIEDRIKRSKAGKYAANERWKK